MGALSAKKAGLAYGARSMLAGVTSRFWQNRPNGESRWRDWETSEGCCMTNALYYGDNLKFNRRH
jgi:hypothetical protein